MGYIHQDLDMLLLLVVMSSLTLSSTAHALSQHTEHCDIIVAGGSTAALAAAVAAARDSAQLHVCLTEPTDWLGGQMTSSGVPAFDFGPLNRRAEFQPRDFADLISSLGVGNHAACWVSTKCFLPRDLVEGWINRTVSQLPNLRVFYNTVIKRVTRQGHVISAVDAVQRTPTSQSPPYTLRMSADLRDWYSEQDSLRYTKTLLRLEGDQTLVVVEATEFGDVLVTSGSSFRQGVEAPTESSSDTLDTCGQAFTFPFYIQNDGNGSSSMNNSQVPTASSWDQYSLGNSDWGHIWSYRRVSHPQPGPQYHAASPRDISDQNWGTGNDYKARSVFLSVHEAMEQQRTDWLGGVNFIALHDAEERAYGWFHYYVNIAPSDVRESLRMAGPEVTGTHTGLSKVPYIRDSRRSVGLNNFQLQKADFAASAGSGPYGVRYTDTVALGDYLYADVHGMLNCPYPDYINDHAIKPFYIPFRALTNKDVHNMLVAGKTMAVTFMANADTRMHPVEWNSGLAAGLGASVMATQRLTSQQLLQHVDTLQDKLLNWTSLDWTKPRT